MAYTINANAKNVWIRDNEDTRDLSIQTDASSVYLDNGRTLEQELGEGSMVSNVATVDTSMSKVIDGTLDGVYESGVMYGRTLVNLADLFSFDEDVTTSYHYVDRTVCETSKLKLNTSYLFIFKPNVSSNLNDYTTFEIGLGNSINHVAGHPSTVEGYRGYNIKHNQWNYIKKTFTDFKDYKYLTVRPLRTENADSTKPITYNVKEGLVVLEYQEGMENWDIPYFEGICDVKMPILRNVGKNLFDKDNVYEVGFGINGYTADRKGFDVKVQPNTLYTITFQGSLHYGFFNNDSLISSSYFDVHDDIGHTTIVTPIFCNVLKLGLLDKGSTVDINFDTFQIEKGSTATSYEPYKTNILRTSEEIVLREVGGVHDTYNVLTGEYTQRVGEVILDGSESWVVDKNYEAENHICYKTIVPNINDGNGFINILCDKFPTQTGSNLWNKDLFGISGSNVNLGGKGIKLSVRKSDLSSLTTDGLKEFLSQNPTTVQYQLESPIITKFALSVVPFAYKNGHIILESGSEEQSLLPILEYSTVVNRTGQVEGVAKVIQKQEKQLTMLEQMLIQNIIGLDYNNTVLALNLEINEVM